MEQDQRDKKSFQLQRYHLKWLCSLPCILPVFALQYGIMQLNIPDWLFYCACIATMCAVLSLYYLLTSRAKYFLTQAYYWQEDGTVKLQIREKIYDIRNVRELIGGDTDVFLYRYAFVRIKMKGKTLLLCADSMKANQEFESTSIYPFFCLVLSTNDLEPFSLFGLKLDNCYKARNKK